VPDRAAIADIVAAMTLELDAAAVAEDAQAWLPARPSTVRLEAPDVVLRHVPHSPKVWYGSATRPRFAEADADIRIAEVRAWFGAQGRDDFMWMIGESAAPGDLVDRLLGTGAELDEDPDALAMVLDHEPPAMPDGVTVRRIASLDDYRASMRMTLEDAPEDVWRRTEATLEAAWAEASADPRMYAFLAEIDGEPVASGQLVWLTNGFAYLGGATTARAARGKGAFRALVRARWDEVERVGPPLRVGPPALLVQAGRMSSPILEGLGFRTTGRVTVLTDHGR
jgi:acetyltransferase (GNAT) family protein